MGITEQKHIKENAHTVCYNKQLLKQHLKVLLAAHNLNFPEIFQLSINPQHFRGHVNAHSLVINFTNGLKLIGDHYSVV